MSPALVLEKLAWRPFFPSLPSFLTGQRGPAGRQTRLFSSFPLQRLSS